MDLDFVVLADRATIRDDGKLDIEGAGWDTIWSSDVPTVHRQLTVVGRVLVSRHEVASPHRLDLVLQGADGAELARAIGEVEPLPEDARQQIPAGRQAGLGLVLNFQNVVFPEYGAYQLVILWDGTEVRPPLRLFLVPTD